MAFCAFCLRGAKLSGEHVWSDWICELYPDIKLIFRKWSEGDEHVTEWEANSMDHTVKVVCEHCNTHWMSDLEANHAKPAMQSAILNDAPQTFSAKQLTSIAIFAFKTAVIGDHSERKKKSPFFPSQVRRRFAHTLRPPENFQVWIGCIADFDPHHGVFRRRYWNTPPETTNGYQLYTVTWGVGRFLFQGVATRWTSGINRRNVLPYLTQNSYWDSFSIPIWPMMRGPITAKWPPVNHLGHDLLYEFSDRWRTMSFGKIYRPSSP